MRKLYKLTDENMRTYKNTQWVIGEWHEAPGTGSLCTGGWLHAYESSLVATFMNPIHANFRTPRLFEAEGDGAFLDDNGLKCGVSRLRLVKELELPVLTPWQRTRVAILCARFVCKDAGWLAWANDWLAKGPEARSSAAAARAARVARMEAAAAVVASWAAAAAARVARVEAAWAASWAARAASWAAAMDAAAAAGDANFSLHTIIMQAIQDEGE